MTNTPYKVDAYVCMCLYILCICVYQLMDMFTKHNPQPTLSQFFFFIGQSKIRTYLKEKKDHGQLIDNTQAQN